MTTDLHTDDVRHDRRGFDIYRGKMLDIGLLLARVLPFFMIGHGISKASKFSSFAEGMVGRPVADMAPEFFAFLIVAGELILPIFVLLGLFTRIAAGLEALMMFLIWIFVPVTNSFNEGGGLIADNGGPVGENAIAYVFVLLPLVFTGPGKYSLDYKLIAQAKEGSFFAKFKSII